MESTQSVIDAVAGSPVVTAVTAGDSTGSRAARSPCCRNSSADDATSAAALSTAYVAIPLLHRVNVSTVKRA